MRVCCLLRYEANESPLDDLQYASHCYATALKTKANDPQLHLKLGLVLEETYYAGDLFSLKKAEVGQLFRLASHLRPERNCNTHTISHMIY